MLYKTTMVLLGSSKFVWTLVLSLKGCMTWESNLSLGFKVNIIFSIQTQNHSEENGKISKNIFLTEDFQCFFPTADERIDSTVAVKSDQLNFNW